MQTRFLTLYGSGSFWRIQQTGLVVRIDQGNLGERASTTTFTPFETVIDADAYCDRMTAARLARGWSTNPGALVHDPNGPLAACGSPVALIHAPERTPRKRRRSPSVVALEKSPEPVKPRHRKKRGFAAMDPGKHQIVASMGGRLSHATGGAHEFTSEEARAAGQKARLARATRLKAARGVPVEEAFTREVTDAARSKPRADAAPTAWTDAAPAQTEQAQEVPGVKLEASRPGLDGATSSGPERDRTERKPRRPRRGESLAEVRPDLAEWWHPTRNGALTPNDVSAGSDVVVWWWCIRGPDHEWPAAVRQRTKVRTQCPFCADLELSVTNSLARRHPELAAQWHPERNGSLRPDQIIASSRRRAWWRCSEDPAHEWDAFIHSRVNGAGCPICKRSRRSRGP